MDRDIYKKAFNKVNVSEDCVKGVLNMGVINGKKKKKNQFKWAVPVIVIVAMMSGITVAAYGFGFGDMFKGYFEDTDSNGPSSSLSDNQLQQIDKAGVELLATATDNGTTINVNAAIGDKNTAYIMFDVIAPQGTVLDRDDYVFADMPIELNRTEKEKSNGNGVDWGITTLKDDNLTDNKKSFILALHASNLDLQNRNIKLSLNNLSIEAGKLEYETIIEGKWDFNLKLAYDTQTKEFDVNKFSNYKGANANVITGSISSISASVTFKGGTAGSFDGQMNNYITPELVVNYKDGTSSTARFGGGSGSDNGMVQNYTFDMPLDLSTVKSITLGDLEIPIK